MGGRRRGSEVGCLSYLLFTGATHEVNKQAKKLEWLQMKLPGEKQHRAKDVFNLKIQSTNKNEYIF